MPIPRVPTGIKGLDQRMQGGFFDGSVNLLTGKTGTGKSAFCASFLYDGLKRGESCFYITTEQRIIDQPLSAVGCINPAAETIRQPHGI